MKVWACVAPLTAVAAAQPEHEAWWTPSEAARFQAFSWPLRRQVFLSGRWLLRWLLARASGGDALRLAIEGDGAPRCLARPTWSLSISHSTGWVAAAVSELQPLGLDLECESPRRDWRAMADWLGLAVIDATAFYRYWTLGEAWLKASTEPRGLHEAASLHWRDDERGPAWQARDPGLGLHVALWAAADPVWVDLPGCEGPSWIEAGRWTPSRPIQPPEAA